MSAFNVHVNLTISKDDKNIAHGELTTDFSSTRYNFTLNAETSSVVFFDEEFAMSKPVRLFVEMIWCEYYKELRK